MHFHLPNQAPVKGQTIGKYTTYNSDQTFVLNLSNFFGNEISIVYKAITACQEEIMSLYFSAACKLHALYISKERPLSINISRKRQCAVKQELLLKLINVYPSLETDNQHMTDYSSAFIQLTLKPAQEYENSKM